MESIHIYIHTHVDIYIYICRNAHGLYLDILFFIHTSFYHSAIPSF
jgi:hypothetical protein